MAEPLQALLERAAAELEQITDSAWLDAEVLLCHCLEKSRSFLRAWPQHQPSDQQCRRFDELIGQRRLGQPVAYLIGSREFWSMEFEVSPAVLIPRPDSELLIELTLERLPANRPAKIIDLGTGSGILAVTLAVERPQTEVIAVDVSEAAIQIAKRNAERLGAQRIRFLASDWFSEIDDSDFDFVVSNPPYIAGDDPHLRQGDLRFEPSGALISNRNGLADIEAIADQARQRLKPGGQILVEHGYNQAQSVLAIFERYGYRQIECHHDLAGNPRVTTAIWNPA